MGSGENRGLNPHVGCITYLHSFHSLGEREGGGGGGKGKK